MEILTLTLQAGVTQQYRRGAVGLEILSSTGAVDINTYSQQGGQNASMTQCLGGQFIKLRFGGFDIKSATAQTVKLLLLDEGEDGGSRNVALNGSLNIGAVPAPQAAHVCSSKAVTTGSTQILAAKSTRQYLLIQNPSSTNSMAITTDGSAAVLGAGSIQIPPGGFYEPSVVPTGAIMVIGSAAFNCTAVEG